MMVAKKKKKAIKKGPRYPRRSAYPNLRSVGAWFRKREGASKGGWGFIPINWKGWAALSLLIILNVFAALYFELNFLEGRRWAKFGVVFLLSILVFILIAKNKTRGVKDDL